jgi:hypothetical protein
MLKHGFGVEQKPMNPLVSFGGGILTSLVTQATLGHYARKHLAEDVPTVRGVPSAFKGAKKDYGMNIGYVHDPKEGENAFYITKEDLKDALQNSDNDPFFDAKPITKMLHSAKQHGLVITGKGYKKPGVIEHEIGHAIAKHKGTPWERFTHSWAADPLMDLGWGLGIMGGQLAGTRYPGLKGRALGALVGGGIAGLGTLPSVSREMSADRYAKDLMSEDMAKRVKTWPFIGGYANPGITLPLVSGFLAHA